MVLVSTMEHHSNDLPWRAAAHVVHVGVTPKAAWMRRILMRSSAAMPGGWRWWR